MALALLAAVPLIPPGFMRAAGGLRTEYLAYGSRLDWSIATGEVVFDRADATDLKYEVYVGLSAEKQQCLTCTDIRFPGHNGNPEWHPSGRYILFQAEDVTLPFLPPEKDVVKPKLTSPGWGTSNNLWLMSRDGVSAWLLRQIDAGQATLHPQFSPDGRKIAWAEKIGLVGLAELWVIKIADFVLQDGQPQLQNIIDVAPLGIEAFYETHGFTADGNKLLFTAGDPTTRSLDIYSLELAGGLTENLTNSPGEWDEHAHMSPDGTKIIWSSARDIDKTRNYIVPYLDYWMMDSDGRNQRRLTFFNEPTALDFVPDGAVTGDFSFSADSRAILARVELPKPDLGQRAEVIVRIQVP